MERKIIVHVLAYYNEVWKYQENYLAEEQALLGHKVHVVASSLNFPYAGYASTSEKDLGPRQKQPGSFNNGQYYVHYLPVLAEFSGRVLLKGLIPFVASLNPDLIYCHGVSQPATFQLINSAVLRNCPKIVDEHMLYSDISNSYIKRFLLSIFGRITHHQIAKGYQRVIGISAGTCKVLQQFFMIPAEKISLIPLGTDVKVFYPDEESGKQFREKHGISQEIPVVGHAGKIEPRKKIELLIDALAEKGMPEAHLLIAGNPDHDYEPFIRRRIEETGISCTFLPSQPKEILPAFYNACDLLAWPAHQTISMMDVAACGKPFICADYLSERLERGQGWGIPSGDPVKLKEALQVLLSNPEKRKEMGRNARRWAEEELSWEKINQALMEPLAEKTELQQHL